MWKDAEVVWPLKDEEVLVLLKNLRIIVRATFRYDYESFTPYWHASSWGKYYTKEVSRWMEIPSEEYEDDEEFF